MEEDPKEKLYTDPYFFDSISQMGGPKMGCKDGTKAIALKMQGDLAFQDNNWTSALKIYNESLMMTPTENAEDFAILLANRSAVLFHMKEYKLAIRDIGMATINYPKEKMYKIKDRLAKCYLSIGNFHNSLNAYREMIDSLKDCQMPYDIRIKSEKDARMMIKNLQAKLSKFAIQEDVQEDVHADDDTTTKLNDSVGFGYNTLEGHYAKANNGIKVGESIVIEKPHCSTLSEEYCKTHCQHCFLRTIAPIVCPNCSNVIFCSNKCKDLASSYHAIECKFLPFVWGTRWPHAHMALKIISQKPLQYFIDIKDQLNDNLKFEDILTLPTEDYRTVFTLVQHENDCSPSEFEHESMIAEILTYLLRQRNYFSSIISNLNQLSTMSLFIEGLILRHLKFTRYNAYSVNETEIGEPVLLQLGSAIYPKMSRFNHSCNPNIVRIYKGTTVYVYALTSIKPGQVIADSYGPNYGQTPYDERQRTLQEGYKFNCICEACSQKWPLYMDDMDVSKLRFKCAGGDTNCKNVLLITLNNGPTFKNKVKCNKCKKFTNVSKGMAYFQQLEMLDEIAQHLDKCGENLKAAEKYCEMITIIDKFMVLPTIEHRIAQESYRQCLNLTGNLYKKDMI